MKRLLSIAIAISLVSCSNPKEDQLNKFDKLTGLWQTNDGETDLYEEWSKPDNNYVLYGKSYRMNDSDSLVDERVELKKQGNDYYYIPTVQDQNDNKPVPFKMISSTDTSFVFENKEHDFPQRIIYRFVGKDSLVARIEGKVNGEERSKDYYYHRVQNYKARALPFFNSPDFTPVFLASSSEKNTKISHTIAPFSFEDQDGKLVSNKDVEGKIHVANFIFTSCGSICPKMTNSMSKVSDAFLKDHNVVLLSFSVTPWIDTKEVLKRYKENHNISNPNWHFLTGEKAEIYKLARQSYFAEEDLGFTKDSSEFLHTEHFILVDKSQRIRGIYNGTLELDIQTLIKDIQTLKKEED